MSKWSVWVMEELQDAFPDLRGGHSNCRYIGSGSTPSQHAWPNARDLYHVAYGYSTSAAHQEYLDQVNSYIQAHFDDLSIRTVIWRKKDHFNHIHIDGWPKGYATPSCMGGTTRYQWPDGHVETFSKYGSPDPLNGYPELPDKEYTVAGNQTVKRGAAGYEVAIVQKDLIAVGIDLGNWDPYDGPNPFGIVFPVGADGAAGPAFEQGVVKFQEMASLVVTGECDGVTASVLARVAGSSGEVGPVGPQGPRGPAGPAGLAGVDGKTPIVKVVGYE